LINEIMVVTGLIGALLKSSYKWGYYVFGCVAFLFVAWTVVFEGRSHARVLGADINKTYTICGVWTIGLWFLYPIAWGLSEGGNIIASDSEAIFYGVLDILAKPVFGALLIWGHRNIDITRLGLNIREPGMTNPSSTLKSEKTATGATNGTAADHPAATTTV
jgi:bacteriorhodopsin